MKFTKGSLWYEKQSDGTVHIGFTQAFITQAMEECFHVLPADYRNLFENKAALVIESNDGVKSLKSPVTGTIVEFNTKARNFPDRLTEDDVILKVRPQGVTIPTVAKTAPKKRTRTLDDLRRDYAQWNWGDEALQRILDVEARDNNGE
jgi:glycine cleavage system H lipoate-binding protein